MSFDYAKIKALRDGSQARGAARSPAGSVLSGELGVLGGEVGGSGGGLMDLSAQGDGAGGSILDSEEEMFVNLEAKRLDVIGLKRESADAVKLVFPLVTGQVGVDDAWPWNVCGGLIGGPRGNRFCTKIISSPSHPHCGVGSHAAHKATISEGHGYIPSVTGRSNVESAYLTPSIAAARFPSAFSEILGQCLTHEQWIASFTVLPTEEEMERSGEVGSELMSEVVERSKHIVSFAVTPATKKPRLTNVVSRILNSKSVKNLSSRFDDEGSPTDKVDLSFEDLEVLESKEWSEVDANSSSFAPTATQWNSLVRHVSSLSGELKVALEAVTSLAEISESRFEVVDDQVTHLRGSVGSRPKQLGPNVPGLDVWTNITKLSDEVVDTQERIGNPTPSVYDVATRTMADSSLSSIRKNARSITSLGNTKAEYVGQVKPIEAAVEDVFKDLYGTEGTYNKVLMNGMNSGSGSDQLHLESKYEELANQVKELKGANMGSENVDTNDPAITSLKADVAKLLLDNQTIKASLGGEIVKIDNEAFHSAEEVKQWIVENVGPAAGTYEFFFDVTSMLESLQDSGRTSDETMDSQAISRKANHRSVSAARMLNSFAVSVPQVMNKRNNPEPFALVSTYSKWKSNDGRSGLVETIRKSLQLWETRTDSMLAARFATSKTREVLMLARSLMRKSMSFWTSLCNWIDEFYGKLTSKTEAQRPGGDASLAERKEYDSTLASVREEAWRLVINVLTDIFQELALRRAEGQAASDMSDDPPMQSAIVLYSSLKAHKFMAELIERRFERHPVMAPTFNGFLFSERASHGDVKRLEVKLSEISNLTRILQSKVDKKS